MCGPRRVDALYVNYIPTTSVKSKQIAINTMLWPQRLLWLLGGFEEIRPRRSPASRSKWLPLWLGVAHWNTDNPHIHLPVRGVMEDGKDLQNRRSRATTLLL
jgi:hypothetical protein